MQLYQINVLLISILHKYKLCMYVCVREYLYAQSYACACSVMCNCMHERAYVHSYMYDVQCVRSVHYTLSNVQCTLYNIHCTMYNVNARVSAIKQCHSQQEQISANRLSNVG